MYCIDYSFGAGLPNFVPVQIKFNYSVIMVSEKVGEHDRPLISDLIFPKINFGNHFFAFHV